MSAADVALGRTSDAGDTAHDRRWLTLPARAADNEVDDPNERTADPTPAAPWYIRACTCSYG